VIGELNGALDRLEERHIVFGGGIETISFEHSGRRKRSALAHTMAAGETVAGALRTARQRPHSTRSSDVYQTGQRKGARRMPDASEPQRRVFKRDPTIRLILS
jgi:hypothetical protein